MDVLEALFGVFCDDNVFSLIETADTTPSIRSSNMFYYSPSSSSHSHSRSASAFSSSTSSTSSTSSFSVEEDRHVRELRQDIESKECTWKDETAGKDYTCPVCLLLCYQPMMCKAKGHNLCKACLEATPRYPNVLCPIRCKGGFQTDPGANRRILNLQVICSLCNTTTSGSDWIDHKTQKCAPRRRVICEVPGCGPLAPHDTLEKHNVENKDHHLQLYASTIHKWKTMANKIKDEMEIQSMVSQCIGLTKKRKFNQENEDDEEKEEKYKDGEGETKQAKRQKTNEKRKEELRQRRKDSAFYFFETKKRTPYLSTKECREKWKIMSREEKQPYEEQSKQARLSTCRKRLKNEFGFEDTALSTLTADDMDKSKPLHTIATEMFVKSI